MGSEHYCLRWNNHQSNLLGVFSQLLQNESLVDVTLACSEGAPIRAHKVVLSACSSYFQSLFLDHPERHPIVILKDVRFSELQTLVEFMYKGEVNVQYCQLSALLKTAESLKVKGLAEMTNQNTASREPEREPERLRPHSQPKTCDSPMDGVSSGNNNGNQAQNLNAIASHLNSSSSSASTIHLKRDDRGGGSGGGGTSPTSPSLLPITKSSPVSLDYYHRNCPSGSSPRRSPTNNNDGEPQIRHHLTSPDHDRPNSAHEGGGGGGNLGGSGSCDDNIQSHDCGINMSLGNSSATTSATQSNTSISLSVVVPSINSSSSSTIPSDLSNRPSSRSGHDRTNNNGGPSSTITHSSSSGGGLASPNLKCEPVAGPSGLGPVQSVPLSLKKEIDWDRNDEKSSSDTMDYRHSHDSETSELALGIGASICGGSSGGSANNSSSTTAASSSQAAEHGVIYTCMYCGSTFPHQSKLTRHILHTHSLDSLKYREHQSHILSLLPHDLPHFPHRPLDALDPNDHPSATTPMDIDFATAVAAAANFQNVVAAAASSSGVGGNTSLSISTNSSLSGGGVIGSAPGSSTASSAVAAMAACSSGNDPNSVVLCKFCGKSFPDVTSLITHLPVHTGDRPFKCEFCGKAFKLRHHMKDHCRVHTGERPFKCNKCGKTFARSTILKSHEKTHYPRYSRLRQF